MKLRNDGVYRMNWTEVSVKTASEAVEAVSSILTEIGAAGIQIEDANENLNYEKADETVYIDWNEINLPTNGAVVSGYFDEDDFDPSILSQIQAQVKKLGEFGLEYLPGEVIVKDIDNQKWATAWKKYYHPVRVTRNLTIVPSWLDYQPTQNDEKLIILDPGMAFGTGTHPTTRLMLEALSIVVRGGETLLDVGTGSGVLSIAAKHLGVGEITATDIDDVAVAKAKENLDLNPIVNDIDVHVSDLLQDVKVENVDIIVANILAEVIHPLIPQAWEKLRLGGYFLTSGIIQDKFTEVRDAQIAAGFKIEQILQIGDWCGIIAYKPNPEDVNEFTAQG